MFCELMLLSCPHWKTVGIVFCVIVPFLIMPVQPFLEKRTFKIMNDAYGPVEVLDLKHSNLSNNVDIIMFSWFGSGNQKWDAQKDDKAWCLKSKLQENGHEKCIQQDPSSANRVVQGTCDCKSEDQQWYAQPVSVSSDLLMIINYKSGMVFTSNGYHKQVTLEQWDNTNPRQYWSYEELEV